ncbi:hypothetical protein [Puia dinghuensis]|uniref:Transposase (putative) YhgA-like domain-containing protein n=1 Tax=Puia dinghuensis TaxID=1792502 RepID=A0A8J2XQP3_9BACT|nr:hypothetical protein [Puia dinghuensis]GGA94821.1 hypothetical protein GCM10011511_17660 [Puia dinghuensis]
MKRDILWKGIIEEVFEDLLRFVFPKADELFDMRRKFGFLDKELAELYPEPGKPPSTKLVDKLVQVYSRDGRQELLLIHLEVQGKAERDFPERMFRYYYRIFDRWKRPVTAVAIFTGVDGHRIPDRYEHRFIGTEVRYKYNVLRIGQYKDEALAANPNPFAVVVLVAKKALLAGKITEKELFEQKISLAKALIARRDLSRRKIDAIMTFLKNYLVFNNLESNRNFIEQLEEITNKNNPMGMLEVLNEEARRELREKFIKKLFANTKFGDRKIASLVDVPVEEIARLRKTRKLKKAA